MNSTPQERDAFRVQVAAVVAQQAAITEQEIRLDAAREQFLREQRLLLADAESLILHILTTEEHLERRQNDLASREAFVDRIEQASARLARELDIVERSLLSETGRPIARAA